MATLSSDVAMAVAFASVLLLFTSTASLPVVTFVLGLLLPIHRLTAVSEVWLDFARYAFAALLIIRVLGPESGSTLRPRWYELVLLASGIWMLTIGAYRADHTAMTSGGVLLLSSTIVMLLRQSGLSMEALWNGMVVATTANAALIVLQGFGIPVPLLPDDFVGYGRRIGFGANAPLVSFELAIGAMLSFRIRNGLVRLLAQLIILGGLLASGGRGGLLAFFVAVAVLLFTHSHARRRIALVAAIAAILVPMALVKVPNALGTVERLFVGDRGEVSSGRGQLLQAAINDIAAHPFLGGGIDPFLAVHGAMPHVAVLTFAVAGGILNFLAALALFGGLAVAVARNLWNSSLWAGMSTILLAWTLLEPLGPFAGFLSVLMLSSCLNSVGFTRGAGDLREEAQSWGPS